MPIRNFVNNNTEEAYQIEFAKEIALHNINRGKVFILVIIIIEMSLFLANLYFTSTGVTLQYGFHNAVYGLMYGMMVIISGIYLCLFYSLKKRFDSLKLAYVDIMMVSYLTFIMSWAAVITLFDQRLYANVSAYLAVLIVGSIMFCIDSRIIIIPYLISLSILFIGLPYFQPSTTILIGHYVNVGILAVLSWVMARTLYIWFLKDFASRWEIRNKNDILNSVNQRLLEEIGLKNKIQGELEIANRELKKLSLMDELTGIANRRKLEEFLNWEWNRAIREGTSITLLMIDIDYFKAFNDNYGHSRGDECLIKVAQTISANCRRSSDFVARLGGEEFLFIAVNMDEKGSIKLAENIRNSIQNLNIIHEYSEVAPYLTVSIGMDIVWPSLNDKWEASINRADQALYNAKLAGRNRVVVPGTNLSTY